MIQQLNPDTLYNFGRNLWAFADIAETNDVKLPEGFAGFVAGKSPLSALEYDSLMKVMESPWVAKVILFMVQEYGRILTEISGQEAAHRPENSKIPKESLPHPTRERVQAAIKEQQEKVSQEQRKRILRDDPTNVVVVHGAKGMKILIHRKGGIIGVKKWDTITDTIAILQWSKYYTFSSYSHNGDILTTVVCNLPDNTRRVFTVSDEWEMTMEKRRVVDEFTTGKMDDKRCRFLIEGDEAGKQILVSEDWASLEWYDIQIHNFGSYGHLAVYRDMSGHAGNIIVQSLLHSDKRCIIPVSALEEDNKAAGLTLSKPLPKNTGIPFSLKMWQFKPMSNSFYLSIVDLAQHWHSK